MKSIGPILIIGCLISLASTWTALSRSPETGFLDRQITVNKVIYRYQVYVPFQWSKQQKWPVILFLHGAGERGDDGLVQTEVGIGTAIRKYQDRFPAIVVMPQCRKELWWHAEAMQALSLAALERSIKEFNGDRARLYLTGLSMGGYGTWALAARHTGLFAALTPVCGGVSLPERLRSTTAPLVTADGSDPYGYVAGKIGGTPVWIFHGAEDKTVPPAESRKMSDALKAVGGQVQYTEYPGVGHNSWEKAYADPEWIRWLLSIRLSH